MADLHISTGVEEYRLNDKFSAWLNPTDPAFISRLYNRFSELEGKDKAWREKMQKLSGADVLAAWEEGDAMFRAAIDDVLGEGCCAAVAGPVSVLAMADDAPIWMNILLAIIDVMDSAAAREQKAVNPKLQKYLSKYHK